MTSPIPPDRETRMNVGPLSASEVRHRDLMAKLDRLIAQNDALLAELVMIRKAARNGR